MSSYKLIIILLILAGVLFYFKNSPFLRFVLIPIVKKSGVGYEYKDKQVDLDSMSSYLEQTFNYIEKEGFTLTSKEKNQIRYVFMNKEEMNTATQLKIKKYIEKHSYSFDTAPFLKKMDNFFMKKINRPNPPKVLYRNWYKEKYDILIELLITVTSFEKILELKSFYDDGMNNSFVRYKIVNFAIPRDVGEAKRLGDAILRLPKYFTARSIYGEERVNQSLTAQFALTFLLQNHQKKEDIQEYQWSFLKTAPSYLFDFPKPGSHALKSFAPATFLADNVRNSDFREVIKRKSSSFFKVQLDKALKNEIIFYKIDNMLLDNQNSVNDDRIVFDEELINTFKKIDIFFNAHPPKLSEGLTSKQIKSIQDAIAPQKLPKDLIAFYKWHNGLQIDYLTVFEPMRSVLYSYYLNISMKDEIIWKDEYLPLHSFGSSGNEFVKLEDIEESTIYDYDYSEHSPIKYKSIKEMLKFFLEALEAKIIYYNDSSGKWESDKYKLEELMSSRLNPKL